MNLSRNLLLAVLLKLGLSHLHQANAQWTKIMEVPSVDIYALTAKNNTVYAASKQFLYTGVGSNWVTSTQVHTQPYDIEAIAEYNGSIYLGTYGAGMFKSSNGGQTWQPFNSGLGFAHLTEMAELGQDLYLTTDGGGIYKLSHLNPAQWMTFSNGLFFSSFQALAASGNRLIAGPSANGYLYLIDQGQSAWTIVPVTDPVNNNLIFNSIAASGDTIIAGTNLRVFTSTDKGNTWLFDSQGIQPGAWTRVAVYESIMLVAVSDNLGNSKLYYRSKYAALGSSWQLLSELQGSLIYKLAVSGGKLYAGRNDGLYQFDLSAVSALPSPVAVSTPYLGDPFPNPATTQVVVPVNLPESTRKAYLDIVELSTGRLSRQILLPNTNSCISLDVSKLSTGIHAITLVADDQNINTRKLIIME